MAIEEMNEQIRNTDLNNEINSNDYNGSMQQILLNNVGEYAIVEFLIGSNSLVTREGILYAVGISYIVLYDERNEQYTICDLYAIKFVTYVDTRKRSARPVIARNNRR